MTNRKPDTAPTVASLTSVPLAFDADFLPYPTPVPSAVYACLPAGQGARWTAIGQLQPQLQAVDARTERFRHLWDR
jgi:hypothetical protein